MRTLSPENVAVIQVHLTRRIIQTIPAATWAKFLNYGDNPGVITEIWQDLQFWVEASVESGQPFASKLEALYFNGMSAEALAVQVRDDAGARELLSDCHEWLHSFAHGQDESDEARGALRSYLRLIYVELIYDGRWTLSARTFHDSPHLTRLRMVLGIIAWQALFSVEKGKDSLMRCEECSKWILTRKRGSKQRFCGNTCRNRDWRKSRGADTKPPASVGT